MNSRCHSSRKESAEACRGPDDSAPGSAIPDFGIRSGAAGCAPAYAAHHPADHLRCFDDRGAKAGGISVLHRFDSALKIDPHWHLLFADGVWSKSGKEDPVFHALGKLEPDDVPAVLSAIVRRTHKLLQRRGLLGHAETNEAPTDEFARKEPALAAILQSSLFDLTLWGPERQPAREPGPRPAAVHTRSRNCADLGQFSLHANRSIAACNRSGLESMIRYLCRPAISTERVELVDDEKVVRLRLKTAWKNGTTHIRLSGPDFVLRLVAMIPAPRRALLHYQGVFAPSSQWRRQIVTRTARPRTKKAGADTPPPQPTGAELPAAAAQCPHAHGAPALDTAAHDQAPPVPSRMPWHLLMRRVFAYDVLHCEKCGGRRSVIATIPEGDIAKKILAHLKLPIEAEGFLPIRAPPWEDFGWAYAANEDAVDEDWPDLPEADAAA